MKFTEATNFHRKSGGRALTPWLRLEIVDVTAGNRPIMHSYHRWQSKHHQIRTDLRWRDALTTSCPPLWSAPQSSSAKTVLEGRIGTLRMQEWQLNSVVEVLIDASIERLWAALTEPADTEQYFMRSRVTVGDVGEN
jgi:hypothetical protein